jgi:hypothetical protein
MDKLMLVFAVLQMLAVAILCIVCIKWALDAYKESNHYAKRIKKGRWDD